MRLFLLQDVLRPTEAGHHIRKADGAGDHEQGLIDFVLGGAGCKRPSDVAVYGPFRAQRSRRAELNELNGLLLERTSLGRGLALRTPCLGKCRMLLLDLQIGREPVVCLPFAISLLRVQDPAALFIGL